jgi:NAD+ kinase
MMLDVVVHRDRDIIFHDICLNDAVITKGAVARIVHVAVKCDGVQAMECGGDGVIVATPTGSTAYSMSAGGSVIDPRLSCICVTPICAQSLAARPLIFEPKSKLSIVAESDETMLTIDGNKPISITKNSVVNIEKSKKALRMIKLKEDGFFEVLRSKRFN